MATKPEESGRGEDLELSKTEDLGGLVSSAVGLEDELSAGLPPQLSPQPQTGDMPTQDVRRAMQDLGF